MKKFYTSLFTIVFLLSALITDAQTTYNSITSNPNHYTLDDVRFWTGTPPPPIQPGNPCNNCIININSDVIMVHSQAVNNGIETPTPTTDPVNDGPWLDDVTITNSTIKIKAGVTFTINTYLQLFNTTIVVGSDPTTPASIFVNNQIDMDLASSVRLANDQTFINTNNDDGVVNLGPRQYWQTGNFYAGIYIIRSTGPDVYDNSLNGVLNGNFGNRSFPTYSFPYYTINCDNGAGGYPNSCSNGIIYGPTMTQYDATNDFYGFQVSTVLPVQLVLFTGTKQDDGSVKLNWATAQESNASFYDVERSGTNNAVSETGWTSIGKVAAKGNSSTTTNYTLTDKTPLAGTGYYKLKMVDLDGKTTYSKIITISDSKDDRDLVIYSNPFTDQIRMKVNVGRGQTLKLLVTDMLGRSVVTSTYQASVGDNYINLVPKSGGSGMYILHITGDTYDKTVKLEKY